MIAGLLILFGFQLLGEFTVFLLAWPLPGSVVGAIYLLGFLVLRGSVPQSLDLGATKLLQYMPLLLVPASAGVINYLDLFERERLALVVSILISTLIAVVSTGWLMQRVLDSKK